MRTAIIIGAGPAGLTAAYELLQHTDVIPIVLEADSDTGGLSKTVNYKGNRIDIGGHRFFSKNNQVMQWWQSMLPIEGNGDTIDLTYQNKTTSLYPNKNSIENADNVMLIRQRLSRIYFLEKFFNYPLRLTFQTLKNLGIVRLFKIGVTYFIAKIAPRKPEITLEDFYINRFGKELYITFFKDYTEKVWGVPVSNINASWGAQRVKGLSLTKTIMHAVFSNKKRNSDINQKETETSLIEKFLYPKFGPGQMWQVVAKKIIDKGGSIHLNHSVKKIINTPVGIEKVIALNKITGEEISFSADFVFSTMPVKDLVNCFSISLPEKATKIANNLIYRDFITVGLLVKKLIIKNPDGTDVKDNWIYIQDKNVQLGRLQIFNNWSPFMVNDPNKVWLGLEYFCNENDALWNLSNEAMIDLAKTELEKIKIINKADVEDGVVIKMPKTYPSYVGAYEQFDLLKTELNKIENLFLIGRNGMHKYNNQDHSMLTAIQAVENIKLGIKEKTNIWDINTEEEYHEEK